MEMIKEYIKNNTASRHKDMGWVEGEDGRYRHAGPPPRPITFGVRLEGQRPGETFEEAVARSKKEEKIFSRLLAITLSLAGVALIATIFVQAFK